MLSELVLCGGELKNFLMAMESEENERMGLLPEQWRNE